MDAGSIPARSTIMGNGEYSSVPHLFTVPTAPLISSNIKAHFLICFLSLMIYRFLEKKLGSKYICEELLDTLKAMKFVEIQEQGFMPAYKRVEITDMLHDICGFRTDYQFIAKSQMKTIQKKK